MISDQRRREILDLLQERGFASLQELVAEVGASESTVRRDLDLLDGHGVIRRTRGGAIAVGDRPPIDADGPPPTTAPTASKAKRAIGAATADLLQQDETVLIDGGSTTLEVARAIQGRPLQVVTNSVPVASVLQTASSLGETVLLGGVLDARTGVTLGPLTTAAIDAVRVQTLILGCGGVRDGAMFNRNSLLVDAQRRMLDAADRRILVADSQKFGHAELVQLCTLDRIDRLVTDEGLPEEWRRRLEETGIVITYAS